MSNIDTSWWPQNYYIQPHYKTMPEYLRVEDIFAKTIKYLPHRRLWRKARDIALIRWAPVINWVTSERKTGYRNQRITLTVEDIQPGIGGWAGFEVDPLNPHDPTDCCPGMAWVHVDLDTWKQTTGSLTAGPLAYVITHELGHTLGFGHGGTGVMAVPRITAVPNSEEIKLAKEYWKVVT